MKLAKGDRIAELNLPNIKGGQFDIESLKGKKTLLTFYRFAQCPFCNLRVNEFVKRYPEFKDNLKVVAIFDSPLDHLVKSTKKHNAPFEILADESFKYFREYEVEQSAWKFFLGSFIRFHKIIIATLKGYIIFSFKGSMTTVPVDILINEDGVIEKAYYGKNTTDHLSFKEILEFSSK
jgi:peroxiredoxin